MWKVLIALSPRLKVCSGLDKKYPSFDCTAMGPLSLMRNMIPNKFPEMVDTNQWGDFKRFVSSDRMCQCDIT